MEVREESEIFFNLYFFVPIIAISRKTAFQAMAISSGTKGFLVGVLVALVLVAFLQQFKGFYHSPHKVSEDQMQVKR